MKSMWEGVAEFSSSNFSTVWVEQKRVPYETLILKLPLLQWKQKWKKFANDVGLILKRLHGMKKALDSTMNCVNFKSSTCLDSQDCSLSGFVSIVSWEPAQDTWDCVLYYFVISKLKNEKINENLGNLVKVNNLTVILLREGISVFSTGVTMCISTTPGQASFQEESTEFFYSFFLFTFSYFCCCYCCFLIVGSWENRLYWFEGVIAEMGFAFLGKKLKFGGEGG